MSDLPVALLEGVDLPIGVDTPELDTPALLVDLDIVEANIRRMADFAARNGFSVRPHIKTHKSIAVAKRQIAAGAAGICAAAVSEGEVMANGGIKDILIAYPIVGARKLTRLAPLFEKAVITLAADSADVIKLYSEFAAHIGRRIEVLLEIDTGMHRVGAAPESASDIAKTIAKSKNLEFRGIMTHAGHAHDVTAPTEIATIARQEAAIMGGVREDLERDGFTVAVVSAGSSVTAAYFRSDDGITEIRPGTYIYNDLRTLSMHSCTPDGLAVTALATVVSVADDRLTIDAGSKTLTITKDPTFGYGLLRDHDTARFSRLSEEHGVLHSVGAKNKFRVGQRVRVIPVHVCVWMDLQSEIYGIRGPQIVERITVDAMRHSL